MKGFASLVTFEIAGGIDVRFTDACKIPYIAPSLDGVESLVEMPVQAKGRALALGITDTLVRLAYGIEDADNLIADLKQALGRV